MLSPMTGPKERQAESNGDRYWSVETATGPMERQHTHLVSLSVGIGICLAHTWKGLREG